MWANIKYYGIPLDLLRCYYSINRGMQRRMSL